MTTTEITPERTCTNPACDWRGAAADCRHIGADAASVRTLAFDLCPKCATPKQSWRAVPLLPVLFFDADGNGPNVVNLWIEEVREYRDGERLIAPRSIGLRFEPADSFPVPAIARPGGFHLRDEDAVTLRDAITAAIDAPRLAARKTPEVIESDEDVTLLRTAHEWGVQIRFGRSEVTDGQIEWFAGPDAESEARSIYADQQADPPDIEIAPHPAAVDPREAEASALWLTQPVRCVSSGDPRMHARCGWAGVGADVARANPRCPTCGAGVDAVPRYVVGTVAAAPDGALVAVFAFADSAECACVCGRRAIARGIDAAIGAVPGEVIAAAREVMRLDGAMTPGPWVVDDDEPHDVHGPLSRFDLRYRVAAFDSRIDARSVVGIRIEAPLLAAWVIAQAEGRGE